MTKTIEEAANEYASNAYYPAPDYDWYERDDEQMKDVLADTFKAGANHVYGLPLASRLTAEEKERVRKMYEGVQEFAQFYQRKANSCINQQCKMDYEASRDIAKSRANMLEYIFGDDFFKEGE